MNRNILQLIQYFFPPSKLVSILGNFTVNYQTGVFYSFLSKSGQIFAEGSLGKMINPLPKSESLAIDIGILIPLFIFLN